MNDYSIGIELLAIGTREEMLAMNPEFPYDSIHPSNIGYTSAQYNALNSLLNDIYKRYPTISKSRQMLLDTMNMLQTERRILDHSSNG